ncbi:MAG: septum formation family protein [Micrococcus sp.]|nr:septum formation family protein [Micrococcus sp.]
MTSSRRGPLPWSGLATAGLAATLILAGCTAVPDEVDEFARGYGVEINPDRTDITDLAVGDCFNGFEDEGNAVATVDCAEEHDSELLHVVTLPESVAEFPGDGNQEHLWAEHEDACYGQVFEDYVGEPWDTSDWDVYTFRPTQWAWAAGDRTVQCVVYSLAGPYWTGSPSTGDAVVIPFEGPDGLPSEEPEAGLEDSGYVQG